MQPLSKYLTHFSRTKTNNPKFIWKHKRPQINKAILRKKNGAGGIRFPDFKLYHNIKLLAQKQKCRPMEQERRPREKPTHTQGHLIYDKGQKTIHWRKDNNWFWENGTTTRKRMKLEHSLIP